MESAPLVELAGVFNQIKLQLQHFKLHRVVLLARPIECAPHAIDQSSTTSSFEGYLLRLGQQVSETGMSAMERLKVWLNQQIANILGDLQEREPVEDPSPARAGCRIFFMVSLLLGFSWLLVYTFIDAPDARVVQIHRLTSGDKNHAFPGCFLYDRNSPDCTKWSRAKFPLRIPVSCPCTNTSAPWKNFVKFYMLHENSTDWNMKLRVDPFPIIVLPNDTIRLGNENIVKGAEFLTAEKFCDLSYLWPFAEDSTSFSSTTGLYEMKKNVRDDPMRSFICDWMAFLLFPGSNTSYEDRTRSTQFLNTPSLLNREELSMHMAKLARESVLTRRLRVDMALPVDVGNENFRRFYNELARLLAGLLDRDEMDLSQSYIYGARKLYDNVISSQYYDIESLVWYLEDDSGLIFLQPEIDWEAYRQTCSPEHCEVTVPMRGARKLYWAFGIVGGVATIVLAVVTTLLWPCTATLLLWISKRKTTAMVVLLLWLSKRQTAEKGGARHASGALVGGPQPVELSSPLDSETLNSL